MGAAVRRRFGPQHTCSFSRCDLTLPLDDPVNAGLAASLDTTSLYVCAHAIAENALKLRASKFIFFRQLFHRARPGAVWVMTEATHRQWPEVSRCLLQLQH